MKTLLTALLLATAVPAGIACAPYLPSLATFLATFAASYAFLLALLGWCWWMTKCSLFEWLFCHSAVESILGGLFTLLLAVTKGD